MKPLTSMKPLGQSYSMTLKASISHRNMISVHWPKHTCNKKVQRCTKTKHQMLSWQPNDEILREETDLSFAFTTLQQARGKEWDSAMRAFKGHTPHRSPLASVPSSSQLRKRIKRNTDTAPFASGRDGGRGARAAERSMYI